MVLPFQQQAILRQYLPTGHIKEGTEILLWGQLPITEQHIIKYNQRPPRAKKGEN